MKWPRPSRCDCRERSRSAPRHRHPHGRSGRGGAALLLVKNPNPIVVVKRFENLSRAVCRRVVYEDELKLIVGVVQTLKGTNALGKCGLSIVDRNNDADVR